MKLVSNKSKDWTGVTIGGNEIVSTPGHKYYLPENEICREVGEKHEHAIYEELSVKWVSACNLKIGDKVLLSTGEYGIVQKVRSIHYNEPQTTYNFEVEGYHTYFVGENSVCVHNNGGDCGKPWITRKAYKEMKKKLGPKGARKFVDAMNKGVVAKKGEQGIKWIGGAYEKGGMKYNYEVKVFGELHNYRLYGNQLPGGKFVFEVFDDAMH